MISPCIKKCTLDNRQYCQGCKRHITEIAQWSQYTEEHRKQILTELKSR